MCHRDPDTGRVTCGMLRATTSCLLASMSPVTLGIRMASWLCARAEPLSPWEHDRCIFSQVPPERHWQAAQQVSQPDVSACPSRSLAAPSACIRSSVLLLNLCRPRFAGLTSTIICFPLETVRTRLAVAPQGQFHGMIHCARQIVSREGFGSLFKVQRHHLLLLQPIYDMQSRLPVPRLADAFQAAHGFLLVKAQRAAVCRA